MTTQPLERTNETWLEQLRATGPATEAAQRDLRELVARAMHQAAGSRGASDPALLEDLTQVAMMKVLANLERFEGRSRFTTWAWSVSLRAAFSELRRALYREEHPDEQPASEAPSPAPDPADHAEREEIVALLHRVIEEELTERQRTAILGELSGRPRPELLAELGTNAGAFHKLVHDARAKLKNGLVSAGICDHEVRQAFDL